MKIKHDIFLSHNSDDKEDVKKIAKLFQDLGISIFLDSWDIKPGEELEEVIQTGLTNSKIIAVFVGPSGFGPYQIDEILKAQELANLEPDAYRVVPILLPGGKPEMIPPSLRKRLWVDLREKKKWEESLQGLVRILQAKVQEFDYSVDFYNRKQELKQINLEELDKSFNHLVLVDGPTGYGKTQLLKYLFAQLNAEQELYGKWSSYYLDLAECRGDQIAYVVEEISGRKVKLLDNDKVRSELVSYLVNAVSSSTKSGNLDRGLVLLIDSVDKLHPYERKWMCAFLGEMVDRSFRDPEQNEVYFHFRSLVAGRNTNDFWQQFSDDGIDMRGPNRIQLSPFDLHAIEDLVWKKNKESSLSTSTKIVSSIAKELMYLGGGHPGVIHNIADKIVQDRKDAKVKLINDSQVRSYFGDPQPFAQRFISHVAQEIYNEISPLCGRKTCDVLQAISCFRLVDSSTIRKLMESAILDDDIDPGDELSKLMQAKIYSPPKRGWMFYQDHLVRRVLSLELAYGNTKDELLFQRIHEAALELYEAWVEHAGKEKQIFAVVEWLYHAFQTEELTKKDTKERFISLLNKLEDIDNYSIKDLVHNTIVEDAEIEYLRLKRFGKKDKLSAWFG
jgi:hypothetical protein